MAVNVNGMPSGAMPVYGAAHQLITGENTSGAMPVYGAAHAQCAQGGASYSHRHFEPTQRFDPAAHFTPPPHVGMSGVNVNGMQSHSQLPERGTATHHSQPAPFAPPPPPSSLHPSQLHHASHSQPHVPPGVMTLSVF